MPVLSGCGTQSIHKEGLMHCLAVHQALQSLKLRPKAAYAPLHRGTSNISLQYISLFDSQSQGIDFAERKEKAFRKPALRQADFPSENLVIST